MDTIIFIEYITNLHERKYKLKYIDDKKIDIDDVISKSKRKIKNDPTTLSVEYSDGFSFPAFYAYILSNNIPVEDKFQLLDKLVNITKKIIKNSKSQRVVH